MQVQLRYVVVTKEAMSSYSYFLTPAKVFNIPIQDSHKGDWHKEYMEGASMEIYRTPLPSVFLGWTFSDIAAAIYSETRSVLIGFEIFSTDSSGRWRHSLNGMGAPAGSQLKLVPRNMVKRSKYLRMSL